MLQDIDMLDICNFLDFQMESFHFAKSKFSSSILHTNIDTSGEQSTSFEGKYWSKHVKLSKKCRFRRNLLKSKKLLLNERD